MNYAVSITYPAINNATYCTCATFARCLWVAKSTIVRRTRKIVANIEPQLLCEPNLVYEQGEIRTVSDAGVRSVGQSILFLFSPAQPRYRKTAIGNYPFS
jgi:hypothetical protein